MLGKSSFSIPPKFIHPIDLQVPIHQTVAAPPPVAPPRAISISTPETQVVSSTTTTVVDIKDESASTAFWDYQYLFASQRSETVKPVGLRAVDGSVPADFTSGTYYLAGPGLFSDDHGSTVHPLDGHGYLRAFHIDGAKKEVSFMAKYVKSEAQVEEHDTETNTWRFTHRGPFSVLKGGKKLGNTKVMKNVANTSVLKWAGRLLCLWEGGEPYEMDPATLQTLGSFHVPEQGPQTDVPNTHDEFEWDRIDIAADFIFKPILRGVYQMPPKRLLSHYKVDARRERLVTVSCNAEDMLLPRSNFTFYEYDMGFKLIKRKEFRIPDHLMIHDWAVTDSHYIIFANRVKLNPIGSMTAIWGTSPMISALSVNSSPHTTPIYLLPRYPHKSWNHRDWRVPIEAPSQLWLLHVGNAFQDTDDDGNLKIQLQASACSYHWFDFQRMFGYNWQSGQLDPTVMNVKGSENGFLPHLVQAYINLNANGECECKIEPLNKWNKPSDFPAINPSYSGIKTRFIYAATTSGSRSELPHFPFDMVAKLNTSTKSVATWTAGARRFVGEPSFVARGSQGDEDDGYLLLVEYAVGIRQCYLVILDAKRIGEADALVARIEVPKRLTFPLGFHGFWAIDV